MLFVRITALTVCKLRMIQFLLMESVLSLVSSSSPLQAVCHMLSKAVIMYSLGQHSIVEHSAASFMSCLLLGTGQWATPAAVWPASQTLPSYEGQQGQQPLRQLTNQRQSPLRQLSNQQHDAVLTESAPLAFPTIPQPAGLQNQLAGLLGGPQVKTGKQTVLYHVCDMTSCFCL